MCNEHHDDKTHIMMSSKRKTLLQQEASTLNMMSVSLSECCIFDYCQTCVSLSVAMSTTRTDCTIEKVRRVETPRHVDQQQLTAGATDDKVPVSAVVQVPVPHHVSLLPGPSCAHGHHRSTRQMS